MISRGRLILEKYTPDRNIQETSVLTEISKFLSPLKTYHPRFRATVKSGLFQVPGRHLSSKL